MQFRAARYRVALGAVWMIAASVAAAAAQAGAGDEEAEGSLLTAELSGRLSAESRTFPATGAFPGQRSLAAGFVVEPTVYEDHDADGGRFHPAHAPPRPPARLPPHSLLQLPRQSHPAAEAHRSAGRAATDYRDRYEALTGRSLRRCPRCDDGNMLVVDHLAGKCVSPAILDSS